MMFLASLLDHHDIAIEQRILTKEQAYMELVKTLCHNHKLPLSPEEIYNLIIQRELEASTVYPSGIAIPHVRLDGFQDILIGMLFLQNPITQNGIKITWIVLIFTDKSSSKIYLNLVSALMRLSKDPQLIADLISAEDGHAIFNLIKKKEIVIKKELYIEDIMNREIVSVTPYASLRELIRLMGVHKVAGLPVVDEDGYFVGEVNILTLFKVGIPEYLTRMDNLDFLTSFEPLENLLEKQDELLVKDIMIVDNEVLKPKTSIIEAVNEMIKMKKRYMSVVDDKKLVGIVTAMDVFNKVIQA